MLSVFLSIYFLSDHGDDQINLLNIHKNVFVLFSSFNLLLVCLLQSEHRRGLDFYNIFNSSDLTLLFDLVPVFFILYLRKKSVKGFALWSPTEPVEELTVCSYTPGAFSFPIHAKHIIFFFPTQGVN